MSVTIEPRGVRAPRGRRLWMGAWVGAMIAALVLLMQSVYWACLNVFASLPGQFNAGRLPDLVSPPFYFFLYLLPYLLAGVVIGVSVAGIAHLVLKVGALGGAR